MLSLRRFCSQGLEITKRCFSLSTSFRTNIGKGEKQPSTGELRITEILKTAFPDAYTIQVVDVSGGCGSMYEVHVASKKFEGVRTLQQHKMVNEILKEEIKGMHGLRISTSPKPFTE